MHDVLAVVLALGHGVAHERQCVELLEGRQVVDLRQLSDAVAREDEELEVLDRVAKRLVELGHVVVVEQERAQATQARKVLELLDLIVRQIDAVKAVLIHVHHMRHVTPWETKEKEWMQPYLCDAEVLDGRRLVACAWVSTTGFYERK
jgi:hypothetical protein